MKTPVTWLIASWLIMLFFARRDVDCSEVYSKTILRRFKHADLIHLGSNLSALLVTGRKVEEAVGSLTFLLAIIFMVLVESLIDLKVKPKIDGCGIGFSGVLLGLSIWELMLFGFEASKLSVMLAAVVGVQGLHYGHLYGIIAGFIWSLLYKVVKSSSAPYTLRNFTTQNLIKNVETNLFINNNL